MESAQPGFYMEQLNLRKLTILGLMRLYSKVLIELNQRGVVRTRNNPVADYTEWLVSTKLGLQLDGNSKVGYDATGEGGLRYQIKGRCISKPNEPVQLSIIRNLEKSQFDFLVAVVFNFKYSIIYGAQIPHQLVSKIAIFSQYQNGYIPILQKSILRQKGVIDLTGKLRA